MKKQGMEDRQQREILFWRDSKHESPEADSVHNLLNKASDARVFLELLRRHTDRLCRKGRVLELGAGQGWASCLYKRLYPGVHATVTDISPYAIQSLPKWEKLFSVDMDARYHCPSYETNEADSSIDLVFCFAAAHHFLEHERTLREIQRILKPGGHAIYFHEPIAPKILYRPSRWIMNRNRPAVSEDVLVTPELKQWSDKAGLGLKIDYRASMIKRGAVATLYFSLLNALPFLARILPASANLVFDKPV